MLYNVDIIFTKKIWSEYKNVILLPTYICGNHIKNMTALEKKNQYDNSVNRRCETVSGRNERKRVGQ